MPVDYIHSADDERLAIFRALPKSQLAKQGGYFITEGDVVTERLFGSLYEPVSLLVLENFVAKYEQLASPELPIHVVSHELMQATVGFPFHRGVMGCGRRRLLPLCEQVIPPDPQPCLLAILPETQDPTNLGVMLRTCAAFGVDGVLLGPGCADPFSRRVIRVSTGSVLHLPLGRFRPATDFQLLGEKLRVTLAATVLHREAISLTDFNPSARLGLLIGSEGHGLRDEWLDHCPLRLTIPMDVRVDSLNANIAMGIFLYEIASRRNRRN